MLKLNIQGNPKEIQLFMKDFKAQPQYQVSTDESQSSDLQNQNSISANLQYQPQPSKKSMILTITTKSGKEIQFNLLEGKVIDMGNGVTYVHGKVFDLFG